MKTPPTGPRRNTTALLPLMSLLWLAACGGNDEDATDTGADTGDDTTTDSGDDTTTDSGDDTATDTGDDTATDTGDDTATDTGDDTAEDAATDSGDDTGEDTGEPAACEPGEYIGNAAVWAASITVEPGVRLCAFPARQMLGAEGETEGQTALRSLREQIAERSVIDVAPGTYALPTSSAREPLRLPMCVAEGAHEGVVIGPASEISVESVEAGIGIEPGEYVRAVLGFGGSLLQLQVGRPYQSSSTTLTAAPQALHNSTLTLTLDNERLWVPCNLAANSCTNVSFEGIGDLRVDEYTWASSPGLGFAAPIRVSGTVGGQAVEVSGYDRIATVYGHHAFTRDLLVVFDTPINGACALRLSAGFDSWKAGFADCDGTLLGDMVSAPASRGRCSE